MASQGRKTAAGSKKDTSSSQNTRKRKTSGDSDGIDVPKSSRRKKSSNDYGQKSSADRAQESGRKHSEYMDSVAFFDAKEKNMVEIGGIISIIVGVVLGIFIYFQPEAILSFVPKLLKGLLGIGAYLVPVVFVAGGIYRIASGDVDTGNRRIGTRLFFFALCIMMIIHISAYGGYVKPLRWFAFVSSSYEYGREAMGGGAVSAFVIWPMIKLFGVWISYVIIVGVMIILVMLVTGISLRETFISARQRKKELYSHAAEAVRRERNFDDDSFPEHDDTVLTAGDYNGYGDTNGVPFGETESRSKRRKKKNDDNADVIDCDDENDDILIGMDETLSAVSTRRRSKRRASRMMEIEYGDETYNIPYDELYGSGAEKKDLPADDTEEKDAPAADEGILDGVVITTMADNVGRTYTAGDPDTDPNAESIIEAKDESNGKSDVKQPENSITSGVPAEIAVYQKPPFELLKLPDPASAIAAESPEEKARVLLETLNSFNISAKMTNISIGPVITRFELQPAQGIRVNKITTLSNDIALALAAPRVRIEAPIPGKAAIGIEVPNKDTAPVLLREVLETKEFAAAKSPLTFAIGKDIAGKVVLADLEKMPHMLIAGQTGSGKSVCINGIILSMVYKSSPKDVRMILVDPKVVELSIFGSIPHLFCPVVTDPKKAAGALQWAVREMEQRYSRMGKINARDIYRYNALQQNEDDRWPRLVIIIDELADLMMVASKDVEESICRIAQLGRACGIHLVVATQRPSVDVITGLIKANIPSRIAFAVSNATDSRVILDAGGAEKLLGRGDMLFHANGASKPTRAQGSFVSDEEVEAVMQFFIENSAAEPDYDEKFMGDFSTESITHGQGNGKQDDDLLPDAVRIVIENGNASISMIQRRLRVGYARAARLIDIMEQKKYVSASDGSKPRKVLIDAAEYNRVFGMRAEENEVN